MVSASEGLRHALIGAVTLIVGIGAIAISYTSGGPGSASDGLTLNAEYRTAEGVGVGSRVTLAGIQVGAVTGMDWDDEEGRVIVRMVVDDTVEIPRDSVAKIASDGMFGSKYIQLSPGGDFEAMAEGDYFEYVQDAVNFEALIEKIVVGAEEARAAQ